ncbi:S-methyl-5-thioribose-1-phosphate isomerase [candidate division WOR-3 bacterium]|nr:S-methyl-5-thioribose-1-phosphate isomerase [candidate division WOR-3 bacterium]
MRFRTIEYDQNKNEIIILDQTALPNKEVYLHLRTAEDVYHAIRNMKVRGAPLIGVTAAYGVALAARHGGSDLAGQACDLLNSARPTAVNLSWALGRMRNRLRHAPEPCEELLAEARAIETEDKEACTRIGAIGSGLIKDNCRIMVHCNAGALATTGIGTALGIIYTAKQQAKDLTVYSCETRPLLQGARLTSWELTRNGVRTFTICDGMAAAFMDRMDIVIVGADRIARNGDVANKIGTRGLAIIARYHGVPFYVAAPLSTFDLTLASGTQIPIEERDPDEVRVFTDRPIVADEAEIHNPAFDITPAGLITGIINERCVLEPPYEKTIQDIDSV